jgi:hypothetical protein
LDQARLVNELPPRPACGCGLAPEELKTCPQLKEHRDMPISDVYTVDSGMVTISSTSQSPILLLNTTSTKRAFCVGIRMKLGVTAAAAGNDCVFTLARAGNSPTGGTAANLRAHDSASATAFSTGAIPAYTIAPTLGNVLGEWVLPQSTGSMWEEFPPLGYEWVVPASGFLVGFVTMSVATSTPAEMQFVVSE